MKEILKSKKFLIPMGLVVAIAIAAVLFFTLKNDEKSFTVSFDTDGGSLVSEIKVKEKETINLPTNPTKDGYKFSMWVDNENNRVTNGTIVTKDINLKAIWIANDVETITVKFDTDGANNIDDIILEKGKSLVLPENPVKEGYEFKNWETSDGKVVSNGEVLNSDTTLYAKWEEKNNSNKKIDISSINFSKENLDMIVNTTDKLDVTFAPANATNKKISSWESDNKDVITVDNNGNIKAVGLGSANITAKTENGKQATIKVYSKVKSVKIEVEREFITKGGNTSSKLTAVIDSNGYSIPKEMISWNTPDASGPNAAAYTSDSNEKSIIVNARECWSNTGCGINFKLVVGPKDAEVIAQSTVKVLPKLAITTTPSSTGTSITVANNSTLVLRSNIDVEWKATSDFIQSQSKTANTLTLNLKNTRNHPEGFQVTATSKAGEKITYIVTIRT